MSATLNKVMLIGNLGQDAETRFTTNNTAVTNFSIATKNSHKDKEGNWVSETTWHNIIAWKVSDYVQKGLLKGRSVYVEGRIQKRDYVNKEGMKVYVTEVVAERLQLNDSKPKEHSDDDTQQEPAGSSNGGIIDDDLPF